MNRPRHLLAAAVSCLIVAGCAGTNPKSLETAVGKPPLVLAEPIAYSAYENLFKHFIRDFVLSAGTYHAVKQDRDGTYYHGPQGCLSNQLVADGKGRRYTEEDKAKWPTPAVSFKKWVHDCGVYVPNDATKPAYIYVVMNSHLRDTAPMNEGDRASLATTVSDIGRVPGGSPVGSAIGTGVGAALVVGIIALESGNFAEASEPLRSIDLRAKLKPAAR